MAMQASEIEVLIKAAFPDAIITMEDLRGDCDHYACRVVSSAFAGKNRVQHTKWSIMRSEDASVVSTCTGIADICPRVILCSNKTTNQLK